MPNMSLKKNEMPVQDANVRNKNFQEVALGYTEEQALDDTVDKEELFARRHKSSLARLSTTGRWLERHGLIKKIVPANTKLGRNAFWLLMIGDDFEYERVEQAARTALGLGVFSGR